MFLCFMFHTFLNGVALLAFVKSWIRLTTSMQKKNQMHDLFDWIESPFWQQGIKVTSSPEQSSQLSCKG